MKTTRTPACPWEDRVLQAFLEGTPAGDAGVVAAHLEECPECRKALDQSRALDALLASRARTEISEAQADRLLAFLERPAAARPRRRPALRLLPVLAGLLALALLLPGRREPREQVALAAAPAEVGRPEPGLPPLAGLLASRSLAVSDSYRLPPPVEVPSPGPELLLAAFCGRPDPALGEARLAQEAAKILAAADPLEPGPLAMAAVGWLLDRIQAGALPTRRALEPGRLLLEAEDEARWELVRLFRLRPVLLRKLAGLPLGQEPELAPLHGALGNEAALPALAAGGEERQRAAVRGAWRTGDEQAARFVLALFLKAALRSTAQERAGAEWVLAMPGPMAELLLPELARRALGERRHPERTLCKRLLEALRGELSSRGS